MRKRTLLSTLLFLAAIALVLSCNSNYSYKKKGFFKINFPEKKYRQFDSAGYPYTFEYPVYSNIIKDSTFFDAAAGDYWINIDVPSLNSRIYISYKPVTPKNFDSLKNDGFKMAYKQHTEVASSITDSVMMTPNGVEGIFFSLSGNTATANQFFLTDSTKHFLRGAVYIEATPNEDSLKVVNDFLKVDLLHLINTLKWR